PPVRVYPGALGPRMLELAGEIADGALLNWLAPDPVAASIRHVEAGARRAGRSLADFEIAAFVRTCVTDDPAPARQWLAREITGYAIVDAYAAFFRSSGFTAEVDAINTAWKAGDRAGAVTRVSSRVLDGLGAIGPAQSCRERIAEFAKAGLTMPVVMPFSPDAESRPALLRTIRSFPRSFSASSRQGSSQPGYPARFCARSPVGPCCVTSTSARGRPASSATW